MATSRARPRRLPNESEPQRNKPGGNGELNVQRRAEGRLAATRVNTLGLTPTPNAASVPSHPRDFLKAEHPVHKAWHYDWLRLERAMRGGFYMTQSLRKYDWEAGNPTAFQARVDNATYVNFPDAFASGLLGYILRQAPSPGQGLSFGTLGDVTEAGQRFSSTNRADLVYYNADGIGNDGSEWYPWWIAAAKSAMTFGHTWIMEESPTTAPERRSREVIYHPYLVELKPYRVWDWYFEDGVLQYIIVRFSKRSPGIRDGLFVDRYETIYYLATREGFQGFDTDASVVGGRPYSAGGWWMFDEKLEPLVYDGVLRTGDWGDLDGEIPIHPLYWERDDGVDGTPEGYARQLAAKPAISRSAIMELANISESYMNLASARDFEVWDASKGMAYVFGVSEKAFNLAVAKIKEGSRLVPFIEQTAVGLGPAQQGSIVDSSMGAVPADTFDKALVSKENQARMHSAIDRTASPDASGVSKEATFADVTGPRLALFAGELQGAMNISIYNLEKRFGNARPTGSVTLPRRYDLLRASEAIQNVFNTVVNAEISSPTLFAKGTRVMVKENNIFTDEETLDKIEKEVMTSKKASADAATAASQRVADLANNPPKPGDNPPPGNQPPQNQPPGNQPPTNQPPAQ